jgi:hypothetical protein
MPTSVPNFFAREILLVTLVSPKRQTLLQYNAAVRTCVPVMANTFVPFRWVIGVF